MLLSWWRIPQRDITLGVRMGTSSTKRRRLRHHIQPAGPQGIHPVVESLEGEIIVGHMHCGLCHRALYYTLEEYRASSRSIIDHNCRRVIYIHGDVSQEDIERFREQWNRQNIGTAEGEDLDAIGEMLGVKREEDV